MNKQGKNILLTTNRLVLTAAVVVTAVLTASLAWNWRQVDKTYHGPG
ncbi:MAG: hypothetical protein R6X11_01600 [Desulfonatronovibrio sp.]